MYMTPEIIWKHTTVTINYIQFNTTEDNYLFRFIIKSNFSELRYCYTNS